jgi:hypothetical protein
MALARYNTPPLRFGPVNGYIGAPAAGRGLSVAETALKRFLNLSKALQSSIDANSFYIYCE